MRYKFTRFNVWKEQKASLKNHPLTGFRGKGLFTLRSVSIAEEACVQARGTFSMHADYHLAQNKPL